jgi:hypothetical protein
MYFGLTDDGILGSVITDRGQSRLLSNLGWVDRGSIWVLDTESGAISPVAIGDGEFVRLHAGGEDLFAAALVQSRGNPWMTVTIRRTSDPSAIRGRWESGSAQAEGSEDDWSQVPHVFVGFDPDLESYVTISVEPASREVEVDGMDWFDESYDWGYQQPMSVTAVPGTDLLLFGVQRSSDLVLYDPRTRQVERKIPLAGRHGNPVPQFRATATELWATDYDTVVRVDPATWEVMNAKRLQVTPDGSAMFIGRFAFDAGEERCTVARPFSGDAVVVDTASFAVIAEVRLGKQPLDVALLTDGRLFARDWHTGELLSGRL